MAYDYLKVCEVRRVNYTLSVCRIDHIMGRPCSNTVVKMISHSNVNTPIDYDEDEEGKRKTYYLAQRHSRDSLQSSPVLILHLITLTEENTSFFLLDGLLSNSHKIATSNLFNQDPTNHFNADRNISNGKFFFFLLFLNNGYWHKFKLNNRQ